MMTQPSGVCSIEVSRNRDLAKPGRLFIRNGLMSIYSRGKRTAFRGRKKLEEEGYIETIVGRASKVWLTKRGVRAAKK